MASFHHLKPKLHPDFIGRRNFWAGIGLGIMTTVFYALFLHVLWETFRILTLVLHQYTDFPPKKSAEDLFFTGLLSAVFGLSVCLWYWMGFTRHLSPKRRFYGRIASTSAYFVFWLFTYAFFNFWKLIWGLLFMHSENYVFYKFLPFMFVFVLFLQNWIWVKRVYRTGNWLIYSLFICLFVGFSVGFGFRFEQKKLISTYVHRYDDKLKKIDSFSNRAIQEYGLVLNPFTLANIKKMNKNVSSVEVSSLLEKFTADQTLQLEDIILERIVFNLQINAYHNPTLHWYWDYATPAEVFKHLKKFPPDSPEATELMLLLKDMIYCLYPQKANDDEFIRYLFTDNLQMPAVIDSLKLDETYKHLFEKHINAEEAASVKYLFSASD